MKPDDDQVARHVWVSGRVQGVGFRWYATHEAQKRGLGGWVRNRTDGRVELLVCGEHEQVASMLNWLRVGPSTAHVESIEVEESDEWSDHFDSLGTV
jgi:acylphosphatase